MPDSPDIRIGDTEREEAMRRLSDHFAAGRLSVAEFDERSAVVAAAVTRGDLAQVFGDLPKPVSEAPVPARKRGDKPDLQGPVMGLVVIGALVLFFTTGTWLWFLMIPAFAIVLGAIGDRGRDQRRRERRQRRREA
ncbi:DUF1707 domain-containing protein [Nocardia sp. CDC159]|uniref:DUF1707 domain-containing protein n=1 Tax=Nocardia pulmonis TaxID=2951408 RepID=A0A9X2EE50_9NOCA|nr:MULTISPECIES: DUF1707 domain-containing protein [Nocardia]MCM6777795.1 DUF1707 domain-containing protein [Nocardia pulmonis]MCM6790680.1 DUF1707 domain-containing protein [Nocardia sp. CDC159]